MILHQVRGTGTGIETLVMLGLPAIVAVTYLAFADIKAQPFVVWWTQINVTSLLFVVFCLFETKGKSLEDIQRRFERRCVTVYVIT